ncbi:hypothetical protein L596_012578 [Steinernema carpocapsae]|uniref:Uncharacterized protein n=1 Tax=Steinernema carpocapsae TaxID=34508 RepID=A0A4U5NXI6_STECR|nr:hypothetical protein L596_012578 [Steinernema carpocapsae]
MDFIPADFVEQLIRHFSKSQLIEALKFDDQYGCLAEKASNRRFQYEVKDFSARDACSQMFLAHGCMIREPLSPLRFGFCTRIHVALTTSPFSPAATETTKILSQIAAFEKNCSHFCVCLLYEITDERDMGLLELWKITSFRLGFPNNSSLFNDLLGRISQKRVLESLVFCIASKASIKLRRFYILLLQNQFKHLRVSFNYLDKVEYFIQFWKKYKVAMKGKKFTIGEVQAPETALGYVQNVAVKLGMFTENVKTTAITTELKIGTDKNSLITCSGNYNAAEIVFKF